MCTGRQFEYFFYVELQPIESQICELFCWEWSAASISNLFKSSNKLIDWLNFFLLLETSQVSDQCPSYHYIESRMKFSFHLYPTLGHTTPFFFILYHEVFEFFVSPNLCGHNKRPQSQTMGKVPLENAPLKKWRANLRH